MQNSVCLVVVFNHRFEKNISKLRQIYKDRFSRIIFIIPFYRSDDPDVFTVYETSFFFQNHISQAFQGFDTEQFDSYVFIGDDLILHPDINENNIGQLLQLKKDSGYIKELLPFHKFHHLWTDKYGLTTVFDNAGFDYAAQLPSQREQMEKFESYNIPFKKQTIKNLIRWREKFSVLQLARYKNPLLSAYRLIKGFQTPVPLVSSYSDFFVVPKVAMKQFTHLCGIYGALNLWVEVAIPTALFLACSEVETEGKNSEWYGTEIWGRKNKTKFEQEVKTSSDLNNYFKNNQLYIHPVKLSKLSINE